ncbi:MAG TPA: elongation factor P [Candidatus Saccharimonadales bacterium]|nr:elongation factor P [Candidatus Saccharimonadales bacterium]
MKATQLRKGMVVKMGDRYLRVVATHHLTPGNKRGMMQTKLKDLVSGSAMDYKFRSDDDVERPHLEQTEMEYLYKDGDNYVFMNTETFEQVHMSSETLGDAVWYMVPNVKLPIEFIEGQPVGIDLPITVDLKVVETEPELKGATASSQRKPATTETGLVVQVPPFVKEGEVVRVSTEDGSYLARA